MTELHLDLRGHNSFHSLAIKNVFELCMFVTKRIISSMKTVLIMSKPLERSKLDNYYARLKWNMSILERAMTNVEDIRSNIKISEIILRYKNENREISEIKVDLEPASFQSVGPSASIKILATVFEQTIKFLRDKLLMTPRINSAQNVILIDKCAGLFESVTHVLSNNVSEINEKLFAVKRDTVFISFEIKVGIDSRISTKTK